jgi:hypothetical protein
MDVCVYVHVYVRVFKQKWKNASEFLCYVYIY